MILKTTKSIIKFTVLAFVLSIASGTSHLMAQIDLTLIGTWSGPVTQAGFPPYTTNMTINNLVIGQASGQTDYPTLPCTGTNIFLSNSGSLHEFSETIISGAGCINGRVEINKLSANTIQFNWYLINSTIVASSGILTRSTTGIDNPNNVQISDIFPNPFIEDAVFNLEVNQSENMSIDLYNYLGMKIKTIYNGELSPGQKHTFRIDGSEIPSGCYFLHIVSSDFQTSKRVLLTK